MSGGHNLSRAPIEVLPLNKPRCDPSEKPDVQPMIMPLHRAVDRAPLAVTISFGSLPFGLPAFWALALFAASCFSVINLGVMNWNIWNFVGIAK